MLQSIKLLLAKKKAAQQAIETADKAIAKIQKHCQHPKTKKRQGWNGFYWGSSWTCLDCGNVTGTPTSIEEHKKAFPNHQETPCSNPYASATSRPTKTYQ